MKKEHAFVLVVIVILCLALAFGNPYSISWPLKCPLYWMTGFQCPLCGMQRMVHELIHLNVVAAWNLNAGLMLCSPYIAILLMGQLYEPSMQWRIVKWCYRDHIMFLVIILMIGWGVARNILC